MRWYIFKSRYLQLFVSVRTAYVIQLLVAMENCKIYPSFDIYNSSLLIEKKIYIYIIRNVFRFVYLYIYIHVSFVIIGF